MDQKSRICIPFILERLALHRQRHSRPFFIGLNGIQGAGKTTLVIELHKQLSKSPHSLRTLSVSIDDLYLANKDQRALAQANFSNPLLQYRGQPGTHDMRVAKALFNALRDRKRDIKIPSYDKSAFEGQGDRTDESTWNVVNTADEETVDVVLFEGWCVGFRALHESELRQKWQAAVEEVHHRDADRSHESTVEEREREKGKLGRQTFENVRAVNESLKDYDSLTEQLDAFIHIDASNIDDVYGWRLQQEEGLRKVKGMGMTDDQVIRFVNGYYPAYELFTDRLREGIFNGEPGKHLRFLVGPDRKIISSEIS